MNKFQAKTLDLYMQSPFRRKKYIGALDVDAIEWAISWLSNHQDVTANPNSLYWLDRLRACLHHYRLDEEQLRALKQARKE